MSGCVTGSYVSFWLDYSHPPSSAADRDRQMAIRTQKDTGRNAHKDTDRDPDRKIILVEDRKLDEDRRCLNRDEQKERKGQKGKK